MTRPQLRAMGVPPSTIGKWVREGWLIPVHAGVYAVGYRRVEPVARAMAAVLACGDGAVLSHDSALALWGLRRWPRTSEVIAPGCVRRTGIRAHRSRTLTRADTTVQLGVPVTRAARALHDMRRRLTVKQRTRLANDARLKRIVTGDEFAVLVGHRRNPTRSGGEDGVQSWIEQLDLPQPLTNVWVGGYEVDAYYEREGVILEFDSIDTHGDPATFASDRERDAAHLEMGIVTVRLITERLTAEEAERVRRILQSRR